MNPQEVLQALQVLTKFVSGMDKGGGDQLGDLALGGDDPTNGPQGWSGINIARGPDDRPDMTKKDYFIEKLALGDGSNEVPHDSAGDYARPF